MALDEFIGPLVKEAVDNKNKNKGKRGRSDSEEMENGLEEGGETLLGHLVNSTDGTLTSLSLRTPNSPVFDISDLLLV